MKTEPKFFLLAGINGAGKSTFYEDRLKPLGLPFINADQIATKIDPDNATHSDEISLKAQKMAEESRAKYLKEKKSFVSETVFSHPSKINLLKEAKQAGFLVTLIFINLPDAQLAQHRVIHRSESGGHDVPSDKIISRYPRVQENILAAKSIPDHFFAFDNNRRDRPHSFLMHLKNGLVDRVSDYQPLWAQKMFPVEYQTNLLREIIQPKETEIKLLLKNGKSLPDALGKTLPLLKINDCIPEALKQIEMDFKRPQLIKSKALSELEYSSIVKRLG